MHYQQLLNTPFRPIPHILCVGNQRRGTLCFTRMQFLNIAFDAWFRKCCIWRMILKCCVWPLGVKKLHLGSCLKNTCPVQFQGAKLLAFQFSRIPKNTVGKPFLTRISKRKPYKNQGLGKPKLSKRKAFRVFSESWGKPILEVAFRKKIQ